jgi:hypothetical protein
MSNDTSTTSGARAHARAQVQETSPFGLTVPATAATDLPATVNAATVLWDETLAPGAGSARKLPRGARVRLTDLDGDAAAAVIIHAENGIAERLNVADTVKVQWQAYLGDGALLLSDMGRVLMSIVADTSGRHDALCGASNEATNTRRYGSGDIAGKHPNARDRFAVALAKLGLERRDIPPNVTFFKTVRVGSLGELEFDTAPGAPGTYVELLAEMPVILSVANTPHPLDPRTAYTVTPLRITAWQAHATASADDRWSSTPERERAFLNTAEVSTGA